MPAFFFSDGRSSERRISESEPFFCYACPRITISSEPKITKLELADHFKDRKDFIEISDCPVLSHIRICIDIGRLVLKNLPSLTQFELNVKNRIYSLEIEGCHPKTLCLQHSDLGKVKFGDGCSINTINFRDNLLKEIDMSFVKNIKELYLDNNEISQLRLHNMIHLKNLSVSRCKLEELDVSDLISLEMFDVSFNKLKTLIVADLTRLSIVVASNNEIETVSLDNTPSVAKLNLSNNKLASFISWSPELALKELDLRNNDLEYLVLGFRALDDIRLSHVKLFYAPFLSSSRVVVDIVPGDAITCNIFPLLNCGWKGNPRFGEPKIPSHLNTAPVRWLVF